MFTALLKSKAYCRVQVRFKFERQQINLNQIQVRANQSLFFEERVKPEYSRKNPKTRGRTSRSMESTPGIEPGTQKPANPAPTNGTKRVTYLGFCALLTWSL